MKNHTKTPGFSVPTDAIGQLSKGEKLHEFAFGHAINITIDQTPEFTELGQWVFTATGPHGTIDYLIDPKFAHYGPELYYGHYPQDVSLTPYGHYPQDVSV